MANIKTDISIPDALYNQVSILANEMQIPENQLFILAMEDYLRRYHQQEFIKSVNGLMQMDLIRQRKLC
jgi:hypothetical protein